MERRTIDFSKCTLYALFAAASLFLYFIGDNGEPLPLALCYGMASANLSPTLSAMIGFYPSVFSGDGLSIFIALAQAFLLWLGLFKIGTSQSVLQKKSQPQ